MTRLQEIEEKYRPWIDVVKDAPSMGPSLLAGCLKDIDWLLSVVESNKKYEAFWEHSRMADKISFEQYEWKQEEKK